MADKYAKHRQEDHVGLEIKADWFTGNVNGSVQDPDVIAIVNLTDSSGGTSGGNTIAAVTDVPTAANAIATLAAKVNALLTALKN